MVSLASEDDFAAAEVRASPGRPAAARVLIIRRRYLGDIVLLEPLIRAVVSAWPGVMITVLANESYAGALELMPLVDRVLTLPANAGVRGWWRILRNVRASGFTHVLDLDNRENTALLTWLFGG